MRYDKNSILEESPVGVSLVNERTSIRNKRLDTFLITEIISNKCIKFKSPINSEENFT